MSLFTLHPTLRLPIFSFLTPRELVNVATLNRQICEETQQAMVQRKKQKVQAIFAALYHSENKAFGLKHHYFESSITYVRGVFHFIPELFALFQEHGVQRLNLSMLCTYAGRAWVISDYYRGNTAPLLEQILEGLRHNTTLTDCNLGLFRHALNYGAMEEILLAHPALRSITLHSGEHLPPNQLPVTVYKQMNN
jgi:hypothetical protein